MKKILSILMDIGTGIVILIAAIAIVIAATAGGTTVIIAAIMGIIGIILKLITMLLSKTEDRVASIFLWSYRTLENLKNLFKFLKAESFFDKEVEPKEAETRWEKIKKPIINFIDNSFKDLAHGFLETQRSKRGTVEGIRKYLEKREKSKEDSKEFEKSLRGEADLKTGFSILDSIFKLYEKVCDIDSTLQSKGEGSLGGQTGKYDGSELDVVNASWKAPAETPAEDDPVITRLDALAAQVSEMNASFQTKEEKTPAGDDLTEIRDALQRIESALGLSEITTALENLRADLQNIIQPVGEGEEGATAGDKFAAIEAKLAENGAKLEEKTNDLGIEVRDSKRSVLSEIAAVKSRLEDLIEDIVKKAMTFDQIYNKFGERLLREHRDSRGRR